MKTIVKIALFVSLLMSVDMAMAQQKTSSSNSGTTKWIYENGFWVIETNIHTPQTSIVRFYTNDGKLIYSEQVDGIELNVEKRKTLRNLKKVLNNVLLAWEKNGVVKEQGELIAVLGNRK